MGGIREDLRQRLVEAHVAGTCLVPACDSDARRLRNAAKRGDVVCAVPQAYALPELWQQLGPAQRELHKVRALGALHPDWVFAGPSAAVAWGLYVSYRLLGKTCVATSRQAHTRDADKIARLLIEGDEHTCVGGVRVTSLARTVLDCVRMADFRAGLAIADSGLRVSGMRRDDLVGWLEQLDCHTRGRRRAMCVARLADGLSESGGESTARAVMYEEGLMIPTLQKQVRDPIDALRHYRVDFFWQLPGGNVAGELDGREKYRVPTMTGGRDAVDVLADERLRESRLTGSGDVSKVARFSFADVIKPGRLRHLLTSFGVPAGYEVPWVAKVPFLRT